MAIEIWKIGELYSAKVTPPSCDGIGWETEQPVIQEELIKMMLSQGCHQTDIGDALDVLDRSGTGHAVLGRKLGE